MSKIFRITACVGCSSCEYVDSDNIWFCRELQKTVEKWEVDNDCPLEDVEDLTDLKEKAAKWDRVKEIAELGCYVCPFVDSFCPIDECKFPMVVKAIDDAMEVEDG